MTQANPGAANAPHGGHGARVVNFLRAEAVQMPAAAEPRVRVDQGRREVRFITQGLQLTLERHERAGALDLYEVAARARSGRVRARFRYLVLDSGGLLGVYRVPVTAQPSPAGALAWVGRRGVLQGTFVLEPARLPQGAEEIERYPQVAPADLSLEELLDHPGPLAAADEFALYQHIYSWLRPGAEPPDAPPPGWQPPRRDAWRRALDGHLPRAGRLWRAGGALYLQVETDTLLEHRRFPPAVVPAGTYRVTLDRATARWGRAGSWT